jgi:hypothetical protein
MHAEVLFAHGSKNKKYLHVSTNCSGFVEKVQTPKKSVCTVAQQIDIEYTTICEALKRDLHLQLYKIKTIHALKQRKDVYNIVKSYRLHYCQ